MNVERLNTVESQASIYTPTAGENTAAVFASLLNAGEDGGEGNLSSIFEAASERYGVPVNLLKAVAKAESNFEAGVTSSCGAMGIMQLMPSTASYLGVTDAYDPEQNIMGGARYLSQLLEQFGGNAQLAAAAYNAGAGNVLKYGGIPPFSETQGYVEKVMDYYTGYSNGSLTIADGTSSASSGVSSLTSEGTDESNSDYLTTALLMSIQTQLFQEIRELDNKDEESVPDLI